MTNLPPRPYPSEDVSLSTKSTAGPFYPDVDTHTWGAFALLAVELGGYGDMEVVNPYTGHRLTAPVLTTSGYGSGGSPDQSMYDALRAMVDEMERVGFLGRNPKVVDEQATLTEVDDEGTPVTPQELAMDEPVRGGDDRCGALARRGTGTGVCDRPLDEHGNCDRASAHVDVPVGPTYSNAPDYVNQPGFPGPDEAPEGCRCAGHHGIVHVPNAPGCERNPGDPCETCGRPLEPHPTGTQCVQCGV